ncbi:site-specific integrase [Paenibacillus cremeus]|uniref:Site-specific integrase n=1 Tax=Paenibacillus cremeus TaxID=2163881 RepID=A0A559JNL8_9BACL|nr:site-specific integrase [Paenibacillus cremeus]TVY01481.1 site-specific integrase [Paenibacillus cremeus]
MEAKEHLLNSKAENTKRAYTSDWSHFEKWCYSHSLESLPADPQTLAYYITSLGKEKKASTIKRRMAAISQRHKTKGYPSPCKTPLVKGVWEGLQRKIGVEEKGKEALWLHELREVIEALPKDKLIGIRNRALLVIGWVGAFRRSELVGINIEDISITRDGIIIHLNRSKTDQKGEGQDVALPFASNPLTCPVRSFEDWITASRLKDGPLFRRMDRHGNIMERLTPPAVRMVVKNSCEAVGLDPQRYSAHSLRSGFCSQAARAGKAEHQIMKQTRHKRSDSLQRYIKKASLFDDNAASGIGL